MGSAAPSGFLTCTACGAELPTTAKFYFECGAAVPAVERETRRTVTLLFTDVAVPRATGDQALERRCCWRRASVTGSKRSAATTTTSRLGSTSSLE